MTISNCSDCGRVFAKNSTENVCPDCIKTRKEEQQKIGEWLRSNERPLLKNIEAEIGVTEEAFKKYLLEGKIRIFNHVICNCEICRKETNILSKKLLCKECAISLRKKPSFLEPIQQKKEIEETKLYSRERYKADY